MISKFINKIILIYQKHPTPLAIRDFSNSNSPVNHIIAYLYQRVVRRILRAIHNYRLKIKKYTIKIHYLDKEFFFPSSSEIGWHLLYGGVWDKSQELVLPKVLHKNPGIFIDIGANIGASAALLRFLYPEVKIIVAEPAYNFREYLVKNLCSNVLVENRIISNCNGKNLTIRTNNTTGSISAEYDNMLVSKEELPTITLDALIKEKNISLTKIDYIKVDTDGHEYQVFEGGAVTISTSKPLIFTEFSPKSLDREGYGAEKFIDLLIQFGCQKFLVFHPNGTFLGVANSYNEIMSHKSDIYYVDLYTIPEKSQHYDKFKHLIYTLTES